VTRLALDLDKQCQLAGLPVPEREFRFHPTRKWRFDFAFPAQSVAVEVEGGAWIGGRHTSGAGFVKDMEKYNEASLAGWRIVRVTPKDVKTGAALKWVERILAR
jgi:very-short-patch-repair endonuclease